MYIVLWLRTSGLEVKESHLFKDVGEALAKFTELEKAAIQSPFSGIMGGWADLDAGKKLISASGTSDIIHAFKLPETT